MHNAATGAIRAGHCRQEQAVGLVQLEHHGFRVGSGHIDNFRRPAAIEFRQAAPLGLGVQIALPGPLHIPGRQQLAILKVHPVTQGKGVAQAVRRYVHRTGKQWRDAGVFAIRHQPFDDMHHHRVGIVVAVDARVGAADITIEANTDDLVLRDGHGHCARRHCDGQRRLYVTVHGRKTP